MLNQIEMKRFKAEYQTEIKEIGDAWKSVFKEMASRGCTEEEMKAAFILSMNKSRQRVIEANDIKEPQGH